MNFIEKHSKILAVALCACACGPVLSTVYAYETQPGWHGEGKNRSYVLAVSYTHLKVCIIYLAHR